MLVLTTVIEAAELEQVTVTEFHTLADNITERRDLGDDGGFCAIAKGIFTVVHHGAIVIGYTQRAGGGVIVGVKVVLSTCKSHIHSYITLIHTLTRKALKRAQTSAKAFSENFIKIRL